MAKTAILLGLFFLSLYLFTMAGHTGSADEESFFYVTEGLAGRTTFESRVGLDLVGVPRARRPQSGRYVPGGLVHSVIAVPLYLLGAAVSQSLPPAYHDFITRLFVGMLNPIVTALTCVLVFLFGLKLGYSRRVAQLVSLSFGLTTLAWPYSKYFFRDPVFGLWLLLAAYAAVASFGRPGLLWPTVSGLAAALAVATKIAALAALPVLLAYLVLGHWPKGSGWRVRGHRAVPTLVFGAVLALVALATGLHSYGWIGEVQSFRFGPGITLLEALVNVRGYAGIFGLLFSPGKSIFLYAPIALLSLVGFGYLWTRRPREAVLFAILIASQLVVHGRLVWWHGDEAWGPRYLAAVVPLLTIPAGAVLCWANGWKRRAAWWAFGGLAVLGLLVQSGGVLAHYLVYTSRTGGTFGPGADERRWDPTLSPIIGQWHVLRERFHAVQSWQEPELYLARGFYWSENPGSLFPLWTDGAGVLVVPEPGTTLRLVASFAEYRPATIGQPGIVLETGGARQSRPTYSIDRAHDPYVLTAEVDTAADGSGPLVIEIRSETWVPARAVTSSDRRELGLYLLAVEATVDGQPVSVGSYMVPPLPVSDEHPWSKEAFFWFILPHTQLLDIWWWHLYFSGLPRSLLALLALPLIGLLVSGRVLLQPIDMSWVTGVLRRPLQEYDPAPESSPAARR